jgi:hypothetical protein
MREREKTIAVAMVESREAGSDRLGFGKPRIATHRYHHDTISAQRVSDRPRKIVNLHFHL